jgi:hypothetical protein
MTSTPPPEQPTAPATTELDTSQAVTPNVDSTTEPTPVGDEAQLAAQQANGDAPEEGADDPPVTEAPATAKSYQVDVSRALQRETQDGKGDEDPGDSDWQGYATEGVEVEEAGQ